MFGTNYRTVKTLLLSSSLFQINIASLFGGTKYVEGREVVMSKTQTSCKSGLGDVPEEHS